MRLVRYGEPGAEKPGLVEEDGTLRDLSGLIPDVAGAALAPESLALLAGRDPSGLPAVPGTPRLGPCVGRVGKLVCIGLNYTDHAAELNMDLPHEPVIFMKATSAICGAGDDVLMPPGSQKTDFEVELAIVIGTGGRDISEDAAARHIAGYCICNDVTERDFQFAHAGQWTKGKSCDTFAPLGPWLVTADAVADPMALDLALRVNGRVLQSGSTRTMHVGPVALVSYVSRFMSLQPGDVISTGTPPGVGMGHDPQVFLRDGDVMEAEIAGLGRQVNRICAL